MFDNDGTLWCEKPIPVELGFILQRLAAMAEADESLRAKQPWQAAFEKDHAWLGGVIDKHYAGDDSDVKVLMGGLLQAFAGQTVDEYASGAADFLAEASHPSLVGRSGHRRRRASVRTAARRADRRAAHARPRARRARPDGDHRAAADRRRRGRRGGGPGHPAGTRPAGAQPNGPLYTANVRSVGRKVLHAVDAGPGTEVVVLDATTVSTLTLTVAEELHELAERDVEPWVAAFRPPALVTARQLPRWQEVEEQGRFHPTALAAVAAFRARCVARPAAR